MLPSHQAFLGTLRTVAEAPSLQEDTQMLGKIQEEIRKTNGEEW